MKNEEKTMTREARIVDKVVVKCNVPCGWVLDDPIIGRRRVLDGEKVEFDPMNGTQLHQLIQVLRVVNNPRINEQENVVKKGGQTRHTLRKKFEIVSGLESLPKVLQETRMSAMEYNPAEIEAIRSLVPDFPPFSRKMKGEKVMIVKG